MRWRSIACGFAAMAFASFASAQPAEDTALAGGPEPPRARLSFYVSGGAGRPITVSLGLADRTTTAAVLTQRREMQPDCTWSQAADLQVDPNEIVPLQNPARLGGADRFGAYYAALFGALVASRGAVATTAQHSCVRRTLTRVAEGLLRRQGRAPGSPPVLPKE